MAFKFLHKFQKSKDNSPHAILPVSYMIKVRATSDLRVVHELRTLAEQLSLEDDEIKLDQNNNDNDQIIIYLSVYGFERFSLELKKRIIHQVPLDKNQSQFFSNVNVGLDIINNHFKEGKDMDHPQFVDSQRVAYFDDVPLRSDFVNATDLLYHYLFFTYSPEELEDNNVEELYHNLCTLARNLKDNYNLQNKQSDEYFATIPNLQDFKEQNTQAIYVPVLSLSNSNDKSKSTLSSDSDTNSDDSSIDSHDSNPDPATSLTNNQDYSSSHDKDNSEKSTRPQSNSSHHQSNDISRPTPHSNKKISHGDENPKTVGELKKEQQNQDNTTDEGNNDNNKESNISSHLSPQDILHQMYAPHLYQMNVEFPMFTVDYDIDKPPSLEDAVKNNNFDSQLFMVQETNHIKSQANAYLQQQAQQVNQSFNFYMTQLALQTYKQLTKRINTIRLKGHDDDELKKSTRNYYNKQIDQSFADLKQSKDNELNRRLDTLKKEYEQRKHGIIAQSNKQYENVRTQTKNKLQSDAKAMMNSSISQRDATLDQHIQKSKREATQYLSHALQDKADKYKDMADNLGQQLFAAMQNHLNAIYPKLVDQISILMNDQLQLNYSNSRLQASNADVYKKQADDYHDQLRKHQKTMESSINDYEDRLNHLREQLKKRDDTTKKYDRLLSDKNKLQSNLDRAKQTLQNQRDKTKDLQKQVHDAPLGQPQMTAKQKSTELNYQALQNKYRGLQDKNQEYQNDLNELTQELDKKKHFWEK